MAERHVSGLRARGGFVVDLQWKNGMLAKAVIHSTAGQPCTIAYRDQFRQLEIKKDGMTTLSFSSGLARSRDYRQRISGPLLDRIDMQVEVPLVDFRELSSNATSGEKSKRSASGWCRRARPKATASASLPT